MSDIEAVLTILEGSVRSYDVPVVDVIATNTKDPFKILVATMLSARTKDAVTARVCERLFGVASTAKSVAALDQAVLEDLLFPVAFYRVKAVQLQGLARAIRDDFDGVVPRTIDELVRLPGVGRKTANLVVTLAFGGPGICVDTHVHRIMNRLGFIDTTSPVETESELRRVLPEKQWSSINRVLVAFGQQKCRPVSPYCSSCPVSAMCKKNGVSASR